jgi:hypothetical protein
MGAAEKSLHVRLGIAGGALVLAGVVFYLRFCGSVDLPARPAAPAVVDSAATEGDTWTRQVADDARTLQLQVVPDRADLAAPFPHQVDERRLELEVGGSVEAAGLRIAVVAAGDTTALQIDNQAASPVAYRVDARTKRPCRTRRQLLHDGLALREKGAIGASAQRGLCAGRVAVVITRVETLQIPLLSYHYVGRLRPSAVGLDEEWISGHRHEGGLSGCDLSLPAVLQREIEAGRTTWRDLADFWATHSCEKYTFPEGYKAHVQGNRVLP